MDELVELTRELVSIPSHESETAAGDAIEAWLDRETDATVTRDRVGNVIARRSAVAVDADGQGGGVDGQGGGVDGPAGDARGPELALVGHHDVVPPADAQTDGDGYAVDRRDGRLYGRGTADMKGAVAATMCAFRDAEPSIDLVFASFVGEEVGGEGARAAIEDGFAPEYAIVGEGSTNYSAAGVTDVVVAHRGRRASTLAVEGTAAHASRPEDGENAIYRACEAIELIRGLDTPSATVIGETIEGTLVVTEIDGGETWNVIPDECTVTIDERTVPGARADLERVESIDGVEWTIDQDLPPMACGDDAFAEAVLEAATDAQSGRPAFVTKPHATDAGWLARNGTDCVVCGPAEPGEAHTDTESVSVAVLERCYRIYRNAAERVRASH